MCRAIQVFRLTRNLGQRYRYFVILWFNRYMDITIENSILTITMERGEIKENMENRPKTELEKTSACRSRKRLRHPIFKQHRMLRNPRNAGRPRKKNLFYKLSKFCSSNFEPLKWEPVYRGHPVNFHQVLRHFYPLTKSKPYP